ncbi:G patch domain-containing protein 1 [Psilocybe cubensis]|uniref:G-patch domain-containing protein n=2 Tax=Psilocybe cubensis TaxID=181762 RepID=A0A8H7XT30_PSICU|nr:G patch domain-containing protein 1 [Psilocybe cubensis]KAH9479298.1 G patch domain-containing protein 1 [Psilocybe cubensis]
MTSRLKRQLDELGVNTSSSKANENFCLIGTPLPPLTKSKDTGEFVPLWKQEVRDEKGRRRLHGAFTGGFSAGYFNTVGSKEGWTPKSFVSSRGDRAKRAEAKPEDFMDEEDLQDLKDSRNIVDTTEEMDFLGGTRAELLGKEDEDDSSKDPITRALQASMLPMAKDSVGSKILKKMGWRLGQGIGPRISLKQRKAQDALAVDANTGSRYQGTTLNIADDDDEANKHTYAPRDTPVLAVKRKDNNHGLGYTPGLSLNDSLGNKPEDSGKGPKLAGGFGLGALNDADEDDLDVYDTSNHNSRRQLAYDHAEGEDDDTVIIGHRSEKQKRPAEATQQSFTSHSFRDGRPVLAGFVLSDEPVAEDRWFPVPEVPSDWVPNPRKLWDSEKENLKPSESEPHTHGRKLRTPNQRGEILGEVSLPSVPRSVFDYMSQKDRERIKSIASSLAAGASTEPDRSFLPPPTSGSKLEPHIAQAALRGFQPFTANPAKQARYNTYLQSQANPDGSSPSLKPMPGQNAEEFTKEIEDYAKAASLFKPISGAMAGRFTSAAVIDLGPKIHEGLHTPSHEDIAAKEAQRRKEEEDKVSPKVHAAHANMYGQLTRERKPWLPAKLLCKRFGVKEPNPEPEMPTGPVPSSSKFTASFTVPGQGQTPASQASYAKPGDGGIEDEAVGDDETLIQEMPTYERPSMDVFKAIFASDDEDSDTEEDNDQQDIPAAPTNSGTGFKSARSIVEDGPIDIDTFKPKFIPREGKAKKNDNENNAKEKKEKKERKEKKKKDKKNVLVSFEMDQDADDASEVKQSKDRPKKKRKTPNETEEKEEHTAMWEADTAGIVPPSIVAPSDVSISFASDAGSKSRKRAIDFM